MSISPRSIVIGGGTMLLQCAELMLRAGHEIVAVSSPDAGLRDWASAWQIQCVEKLRGLSAVGEFDYLFSIVNYRIVPGAILRAARRMAVNYHDGPLPKYAGLHATSWAILNRETTHAITWHVMTGKVDAGDILKQVPIPIRSEDTAASLNFKCHVTAVRAFAELLVELEAGTITRLAQDTTKRTYFSRSRRPTPDCVIPFDWTADRIAAFFRALDFGSQPNPIGYPKIAFNDKRYIVGRMEICAERSGAQAETILELNDSFVRVATASADLKLSDLKTLDGAPVKPSELKSLL